MIVLEKWIPKKPISVIYYDGEKERYYVKRFLIEQEGKEESFISSHPDSQLEIVSTDWRPMADVEFTKERGKDRKPNMQVDLEQFISVKGINALGNQLTREKINQINLMDPLPFEAPEEVHADELEVVGEETVSVDLEVNPAEPETPNPSSDATSENNKSDDNQDPDIDDKGQATLF
jgi:topoisomerase-4 subunit A